MEAPVNRVRCGVGYGSMEGVVTIARDLAYMSGYLLRFSPGSK